METVARYSDRQRRELFSETAAVRGTTPAVVEKDFWVTRTLARLFQEPALEQILRFQGGTSLSKVFGVIERFSEDIDLVLDWQLVSGENPMAKRSNAQQQRLNQTINAAAAEYIEQQLLDQVRAVLGELCTCSVDPRETHVINITYPAAFGDDYLRPEIRLEIGPLAAWTPHQTHAIQSYAAEVFPNLFDEPQCSVPVISAERTFWEKITILHQEAHRPDDKLQPSRYSRHYYDVHRMASTPIRDAALQDMPLLQTVVDFKQRFYPRAWARYDLAGPGTLKLVPSDTVMTVLERDYDAMRTMIYGETPAFVDILADLGQLETDINGL
ncbi:MAG: nucleotidyl transferase AbiEii/AbiGii toxin family protein [Halioglobus sp.]|nr:nucleotidyl transferase AbiEii/AbiGii toxin family protein [Halioglobus sp.]